MDTNKPSDSTTPPVLQTKDKTPVATPQPPAKQTTQTVPTQPNRVIESDAEHPLIGVRKAMVKLDMSKDETAELNIDKDSVVYLIYLLYKTNMIARNNLRNMLDEISKPLPDNVLKWLVNEAAKAGR